MCDCSADAANGERVPETVTLFRKCQHSRQPGKEIADASASCDAISGQDPWCPVDNSRSDLGYAICDSGKRSSSSSNGSSRRYKFVSPREREFLGEGEEDASWEPPRLSFEPCSAEEETKERPDVECTLAIVKPEAVARRAEIERCMLEEGFEIYQTRWLQMTPEQVSEFYSDRYGHASFAHLVAYMASGPIVVHVLAKRRAIREWRLLMGPTRVAEARLYYPDSLRARFGGKGEDFQNAVHGSDGPEEAEREIHFFFPEFIIEPLPKSDATVDYLWEALSPTLVEALSLCCKLKPADPVLWLANWLIENNPNQPKSPEDLVVAP